MPGSSNTSVDIKRIVLAASPVFAKKIRKMKHRKGVRHGYQDVLSKNKAGNHTLSAELLILNQVAAGLHKRVHWC
jgi:hypothetical protein